ANIGQDIEAIITIIALASAACPAMKASNLLEMRKNEKKTGALVSITESGSITPACVRHSSTHWSQSIRLPPEPTYAGYNGWAERIYKTFDHLF
ncbi:MAG: hypothetical protein ACXVI5_04450, partial [Halobacteriota archaeon]